jgi:hypothetical protein
MLSKISPNIKIKYYRYTNDNGHKGKPHSNSSKRLMSKDRPNQIPSGKEHPPYKKRLNNPPNQDRTKLAQHVHNLLGLAKFLQLIISDEHVGDQRTFLIR